MPAISTAHGPNSSVSSELSSAEPPYTPHSGETSPQVETHSRKSRRSIFGLHSSRDKDKNKGRDKGSKGIGRSLSMRTEGPGRATLKKNGRPVEQPTQSAGKESAEHRMPHNANKGAQANSSYASYPSNMVNQSSSHAESQTFEPPRIQRGNTEPLQQEFYRHRQPQSSSHQIDQYPEVLQQGGSQHPQLQLDQTHRQQPPPGYHLGGQHGSTDQVSNTSLQPPPGKTSDRQTGLRQPSDHMSSHGQSRDQQGGNQPQGVQTPSMPQGSSFKGNSSQQGGGESERETPPPPPAKGRDEPSDTDVRALVQKHEELQAKYIKVKKYYFEKEAQVQQLQNTVAHQRMATHRTVLDDGEYATRFGRLDGAINNLAFNIRKDWKNVPPWLQGVVHDDAHIVGTKEMTAVGRACLTRWLVDEIFDRYFHPCLEPNLSRQLKMIERNLRRTSKGVTEEERENEIAKVSAWRRTTLDGLGDTLHSKLADDHRQHLTKGLIEKLTASLEMNLKDPPPPGLENGVSMVLELAVGIAASIPAESRDVTVEYYLPGSPIRESHMKLETTLPPLSSANLDARLGSEPSSAVTDRVEQGSIKGAELQTQGDGQTGEGDGMKDNSSSSTTNSGTGNRGRGRFGFGTLMGKKETPNPGPQDSGRPGSAMQREKEREETEKESDNRIRFSSFFAVEVRGRSGANVIYKAPVYGFA